jgi:tetratricopeptide (TPR) repeat protein
MGRLLVVLLLTGLLASAQLKERDAKNGSTAPLTEEDEDLLPQTEYVFNPIQAQKDVKVGDFYAKKGNHRAAVGRYLEATRWNPGLAEAFWKLAHSRDKLKQPAQALDAYRKYLEIEPDSKQAAEAKKRVNELEAQQEKLPVAEKDQAPKESDGTPGGADPAAIDTTKPPQ